MFSTRLPASLTLTPLAALMAERLRTGRIRADLTRSNPTAAGFLYPETLSLAWSNAATLHYTPASLGLPAARQDIADLYRQTGEAVDPGRVVLTASTSEAYAFLFKLLADPGDRILAPAPSYPLLDHLAALEAVVLDRYPLHDAGHWTIDVDALEAAVTPRTRAVVVVAPNNPTGSVPDAHEWRGLVDLCCRHGLALIVDEVFAPYPLAPATVTPPPLEGAPVLAFRLNGLSKLIALPQAKLGWMVASGPAALVVDAVARLEVIADTFLSVSTPVQMALPALLEAGASVRTQVQARIARNLDALARVVLTSPSLSLRRPQGGWTAVLRVPTPAQPDDLVRTLLDAGVLTHPAYFYDFAHDGYLVVSLLAPPAEFDVGLGALVALQAFQVSA
jgi:aspartate/methionine/tyrosine aminotransferase